MLFEQLRLRNFGVFRGEHEIELAPRKRNRPIILFGALNGAGKTTIIESLQLALYGKRSSYGWRGATAYPQYLRDVRNRHAIPASSTLVEVSIRLTSGRRLKVRREWMYTGQVPKEYVSVFVNNSEHHMDLSATWDDEVERLLPARLAELFFFDGEKIERLADPTKGAEVLRTAVSSLLGLDLIDHLVDDLELIRYRQKQNQLSDTESTELAKLEAEHRAERIKLEELRDRKANLELRILDYQKQLSRIESELHAAGGERYNQREELASERAKLLAEIASSERQLRVLAGSALPLNICAKILIELASEASQSAGKVDFRTVESVRRSLFGLKTWLDSEGFDSDVRTKLSARIDQELSKFTRDDSDVSGIDWPQISISVAEIISATLPELANTAIDESSQISRKSERVHALDELLAQVPEQEQLASLHRQQGEVTLLVTQVQKDLTEVEYECSATDRRLEKLHESRLAKLTQAVESGDATRISDYCQRSVDTLKNYRRRFIDMRRKQLEQLILDSFSHLARKSDLIGSIAIDPESMGLTLTSPTGETMGTQQLSAGERQLLAVSTLWALAKATGRTIPIVIDTPLGRLDGDHRTSIVERYFPDAGQQVVLLSTDTEIHARFSAKLEKWISYRYTLKYEPREKSSNFTLGYFEGAA